MFVSLSEFTVCRRTSSWWRGKAKLSISEELKEQFNILGDSEADPTGVYQL